jgi:hypothetical protein
MRIPRTRGAFTGTLLIIAGLWGGLVPFIGHYFDYVIGPDRAWDWTAGRGWLSVLPAAAVVLGGLILTSSGHRFSAGTGAWLALAGGVWFVVGQPVSELWNHGVSQAGPALGGTGHRVAEELGYFYGLGALVTALSAFALGRIATRSVRDLEYQRELDATAAPAGTTAAPRHDRDRDGVDDRTEVTADGADRVQAASTTRRRGLFRRNRA